MLGACLHVWMFACLHACIPQSIRCDEETCLECTDPLLLSIRRSGARINDPPLPFDEMERELPHALEFGTQDPRYFASAEAFDVVSSINQLREATDE